MSSGESARAGNKPLHKLLALLAVAASMTLHAESKAANGQIATATVADVGRYHLQSNPWVNLHERLLYEAQYPNDPAPPPPGLSAEDVSKWKSAVEAYGKIFEKRSALFDSDMRRLEDQLASTHTFVLPESIPAATAAVLKEAMPLYRVGQWNEDDRANRFWIAVAKALLTSAGEELAEAHSKAYGVPFPTHILVDVTSFAGEFGAYTVGHDDAAHAIISSVVPGTQGFGSLESLMHEPSHAIVGNTSGAIGSDIVKVSQELGLRPMSNLWHAILFYTSGELTRRALAARGVTNYKPFIMSMYAGPFRGYQQSLETHWQAFLDGKVSRESAIRQIVIETTPAKK